MLRAHCNRRPTRSVWTASALAPLRLTSRGGSVCQFARDFIVRPRAEQAVFLGGPKRAFAGIGQAELFAPGADRADRVAGLARNLFIRTFAEQPVLIRRPSPVPRVGFGNMQFGPAIFDGFEGAVKAARNHFIRQLPEQGNFIRTPTPPLAANLGMPKAMRRAWMANIVRFNRRASSSSGRVPGSLSSAGV